MKNFAYSRAENAPTAVNLISQNAKAKFLGGGTNLVDLMRENIEQPDALVDVTGLTFNQIEELAVMDDGRCCWGPEDAVF